MKEVTSVLEFANAAAIERINYELTYDGDKKRCYVDAYKKWENFCVNGAGERQ